MMVRLHIGFASLCSARLGIGVRAGLPSFKPSASASFSSPRCGTSDH